MFQHGPLTRRAPETIRYGTGRCARRALLGRGGGALHRGAVSAICAAAGHPKVRKIRFGETIDLLEDRRGDRIPKAIGAVASSCARSPFAFAVPCHRVLHSGIEATRRDPARARPRRGDEVSAG